ncbi:MAG TPA: hypothetical protein VFC39_06795 [Acidobacteriaceae bacterium]|nr:hypothetical protein [Acidobacteriaceae bacterium]
MTVERPARPALATLICIFELGVVALLIASHFIVRSLRDQFNALRANNPSVHSQPFPPIHYTPLHLTSMIVSYGLALAVAITLWQMRRSAFYLLATQTTLSLITFGIGLVRTLSVALHVPHAAGINHAAIFWIARILSFLFVAFEAAMTWYVYDITKPKPEAITVPETPRRIEDPSETPNSTQSTARFYLASDDDQRKPK